MIKTGIYKEYIRDIEKLQQLYRQYQNGEVFESEFKNFRLVNGIYGQRQKDFYMVRIKVPAGAISPLQLKKVAVLADKYSNGVIHVTTRQDLQFHWVKLEDVPALIKDINETGLTTRDACGNTLRNITASYLSGVCPYEIFEVQRVAQKLTELLIGKYDSLPRKFKIAFSCCEKHSYLIPFNDIGLIPKLKDGRAGFSVYIGGGLGDRPKYAFKYSDFIPLEELTALTTAVLELFNQYGDRKNRRHNRLKFLIEKLGREKFLQLLDSFFAQAKEKVPPFVCDTPVEVPSSDAHPELPETQKENFRLWLKTCVIPQKQKELYTAVVKLNLGNITSGKLRKLADTAEKLSLTVKTTQEQNIALMNIHRELLYTLYTLLEEAGLSQYGASTYLDITACPGSETCGLGITSSRDLARQVYSRLPKDEKSVEKLKNITIKISGCPNGCAHHHTASIGLHGIAIKVGDMLIPAYILHIGGNGLLPNQKIGYTGIKIPAKNVPDAVLFLLDYYIENSLPEEEFNSFVERISPEKIFQILQPFKELYQTEQKYDIDWGSDKKFSLEDLGTGECAGIVADRVEEALREGERLLKQAKTHIQNGIEEDAVVHIEKALDIITSGLLVPFGVKASGKEGREKFIEQVIGRKLVDEKYIPVLTEKISDVPYSLETAESFYEACKKAYLQLRKETEEKKETRKEEKSRKEFLDLRGVECPFNFVKAKHKLKEMDTGSILVLIIDGEESIRSVPQSLRDDGHEIINIQEEGENVYTVVVRKR
ncbi:sulfurtransferase TusA family protein [Persephonella sp.]